MLGQPMTTCSRPEVVGFKLDGKLPGRQRPRPIWSSPSPRCCAPAAWSASSSSSSAPVCRSGARRPRDDRQHGARVRRDHGLLPGRRRDLKYLPLHRPRATSRSRWSRPTARSRASVARRRPRRTRSTPTRWSSTSARRAERSPGRSARRTASCSTDMKAGLRGGDFWKRTFAEMRRLSPRRKVAERRRRSAGVKGEELFEATATWSSRRSRAARTRPTRRSCSAPASWRQERASSAASSVKPWVKTSLAPGSKVVTDYLRGAGLQIDDLDALGFHLVGYGCTTCIGNSGPLPEPIAKAIKDGELVVASVLSGNRNFEGRVQPPRAGELPRLAAAGGRLCARRLASRLRSPERADGRRHRRQPGLPQGHLADAQEIPPWPKALTPEMFRSATDDVFEGPDDRWQALAASLGSDLRLGRGLLDLRAEPALLRRT